MTRFRPRFAAPAWLEPISGTSVLAVQSGVLPSLQLKIIYTKAVSPISSGFPELAPDPEQLEFFSQISSVFSLKSSGKACFLLSHGG